MKLHEQIQVTAELVGRPLSDLAVAAMARELAAYPVDDVRQALGRCARLGLSLSLAGVVAQLPGAAPGPEEAWSIASRAYDEDESVVWTDAMARAFGEVRHMDDRIAARMAFREIYQRLAADERGRPEWRLSPGHDPTRREPAVREAVVAGRLTHGDQVRLLGAGPEPSSAERWLPRPRPARERVWTGEPARPVSLGEMRAFTDALRGAS